MELLDQPGPGALPPKPGEEDGAPKKGPGRPPADPTKRAINDMRYQQMVDMVDTLPDEAKQPRYAIYRANRRTETKKGFRPLFRILLKEWTENNLQDINTLRGYLSEKAGRGCYFIEPLDEHNVRMLKVAAWCVHTDPEAQMGYDPEDDEDDEYDDEDRPRRSRFRRRYRDDVHDDDYLEDRANVADVLSTVTRANSAQALAANQGKDSLVSMLLLTQSQNAQARVEEERRREDRLAEDRRFERERMDRKEREEKEERERRERMDKEDRERKERELREQREQEREERRREDVRRREQDAARASAEAKRTEVVLAAVTTLAPVIVKLLEKKDPPPRQEDPMAMILLKSFVDKHDRADSTQVLFQQMGEMAKLQSTMTAEQMRSMMSLSTDMNQAIMKKALDMMMASPNGQTTEGKSMIEQIMMAIQGASELVKTLAPAPPAPTIVNQPLLAAPQDQNPNRRFARQHPTGTQQQPGAQPGAQQPGVQQQATGQPAPAPEQATPIGIPGVLHALRGIHLKAWSTPQEYQTFVQYLFQQMPLALRVAVLDGNDLELYRLTKPAIDADPLLGQWTGAPEAVPWMREFIPTLKPHIEATFGPADAQRQQLAYLLGQGENGIALAMATPADFQAYMEALAKQEAEAKAAGTPASAPPEGAPAGEASAEGAPAVPSPAEGDTTAVPPPETPAAPPAPPTESHLSDKDEP